MRVEPFNYPLDDSLASKIDLMIARCNQHNPKRDAVLLCEGPEGEGKTTYSVAIAYYIKWKTGRNFNHTNVYFDLEKMIQVLQKTEDQIAIWDEPALQALSKDSMTKIVKNLERLLMMARKKRHFIIINVAYFNKFSDYIIWQRPLGMIHVYSRNEVHAGRYVYIRKKNLEKLYNEWRTKKRRNYKKYCSKKIRGTFPDVMNPDYKNNVLSDFDLSYYESEKDNAIMSIGADTKEDVKSEVHYYKFAISQLMVCMKIPLADKFKIAEKLGMNYDTVLSWHKRHKNAIPPTKGRPTREINIELGDSDKIDLDLAGDGYNNSEQ